jgi:UDP-glucuronate 4-epimerase
MKILLTGGAGFIGSWLGEELLGQGHEVISFDNFNDYYNPEWKEKNIQKSLKHPKYKMHRIDIRDYEAMVQALEGEDIDAIIHLAAMCGVRSSISNPRIYTDVNINGTLNMLELAKALGIKKFLLASSSSIYGDNEKIPFSEHDFVDKPISPYAASKKAAELLCHNYYHLHQISTICLRFFTVYGPRGRPDMAPYIFTTKIIEGKPIDMYGDGSTMRDYTYVADIVNGIISAMQLEGYHIINLGNNNPVKLKEFISHLEDITGKKAIINTKPIPKGDVMVTFADIEKAGRLIGYKPITSIKEGLKKTVAWYTEERK